MGVNAEVDLNDSVPVWLVSIRMFTERSGRVEIGSCDSKVVMVWVEAVLAAEAAVIITTARATTAIKYRMVLDIVGRGARWGGVGRGV